MKTRRLEEREQREQNSIKPSCSVSIKTLLFSAHKYLSPTDVSRGHKISPDMRIRMLRRMTSDFVYCAALVGRFGGGAMAHRDLNLIGNEIREIAIKLFARIDLGRVTWVNSHHKQRNPQCTDVIIFARAFVSFVDCALEQSIARSSYVRDRLALFAYVLGQTLPLA